MVAGGLEVTSRTTRLTSGTELVMRVEMRAQDVVGQARPVGRHRILGGHGAQHDRVAVGAAITLDAHGTNVGEQDDRALPDLLIHTCSCVVRTKHANPLQAPRTKIPPAYND